MTDAEQKAFAQGRAAGLEEAALPSLGTTFVVKHYAADENPLIKTDVGIDIEVHGGTRELADEIAKRLKLNAGEDCPRCDGSGEEEVMDSDGPDAHPIMVNCTHCGGVGSLSAAYKHLLAELAIANSKYLDACGKLYFADISPTSSDAGKDDARDAARYRWLRNESWAGYNVSKGKPQVFETVTMVLDGARNFKTILAEEALDAAIDAALSSLEVIGTGEKG